MKPRQAAKVIKLGMAKSEVFAQLGELKPFDPKVWPREPRSEPAKLPAAAGYVRYGQALPCLVIGFIGEKVVYVDLVEKESATRVVKLGMTKAEVLEGLARQGWDNGLGALLEPNAWPVAPRPNFPNTMFPNVPAETEFYRLTPRLPCLVNGFS